MNTQHLYDHPAGDKEIGGGNGNPMENHASALQSLIDALPGLFVALSRAHTHSGVWHSTVQHNAARHGMSLSGMARGAAVPIRSPCGTVLYDIILY